MNVSWRISYFIMLTGAFVLVSFIAANYQNTNDTFYSLIYLLSLFIFLFGIFVGKSVSRPLKKIVKAANELADGNVKSRVYLKNNDEFGQLAKAINVIAEKLEKSYVKHEEIRHSVATKVSSIVQPFHDTIEALEEKSKNRTMDFHRANEVSEKMQMDLLLKEAELVDLKGQMAKLMKRKSKKVITQEI